MEVQNQQSGQVTVSWTASTRFSQTVTVPAAVAVGDCVTATGSSSSGAIVATAVTISQPSSTGSCTLGFGGRGNGNRPPGTFPRRTPPTSGTLPAGRAAGFSFASGKVTAVRQHHDDQWLLLRQLPARRQQLEQHGPRRPPSRSPWA